MQSNCYLVTLCWCPTVQAAELTLLCYALCKPECQLIVVDYNIPVVNEKHLHCSLCIYMSFQTSFVRNTVHGRHLYGHILVYISRTHGYSIGQSSKSTYSNFLPFMLLHVISCLKEFPFLYNVIIFLFCSVLHLGVQHRRQQLVQDILELLKKIPPANPPLINSGNDNGWVCDL